MFVTMDIFINMFTIINRSTNKSNNGLEYM